MPEVSPSIVIEAEAPATKGLFLDPSCLPTTKLKVPDELKEPTGGVEPKPQLKVPRGLHIGNREITLVCPNDGSFGDPVTVVAYTFTAIAHFSAVPAITSDVLDYIAKNELEAKIEETWHAGQLKAQDLRQWAGMKVSHGKLLIQYLQQVQDRLDTAAHMQAESMLHCKWCNSQQEAFCPDAAMVHDGTYNGNKAVYHAVVAAGTYCSELSQDDADEQARIAAESMLNCFYVNDPFTAKCEERPDRPLEDMEPVPNDKTPIYPGRDLRVGTYVAAAGLFTSYASKEDANAQAQMLAYSMLNCWYPNDEIYVECLRNAEGKIEARGFGINPATSEPQVADPANKKSGQMVTIPRGFITSEYSVDMATEEATDLAMSLLECCYTNDRHYARCLSETVVANGEETIIEPEEDSPMLEVTIEPGTYFSCISKDEANQFAEEAMEGVLICNYCNAMVLPTCVPDWVIEGVLDPDPNKRIPLPLTAGTISYNGNIIATKSLPANATSGMPAGAICDSSAIQAQDFANSLAMAPIASEGGSSTAVELCTYYNDLVIIGCQVKDPYGNNTSWKENNKEITGITPDGRPYIFLSLYPYETCMSERLTYPPKDTYFKIEAGMWSDIGHDKKSILNERAVKYGISITQCMFENPPTIGYCGTFDRMSSLCEEQWVHGKNEEFGTAQLADWASTPERPVYVPRGAVVTRGDGNPERGISEIFDEIKGKTLKMIEPQMKCFYCNNTQIYNCQKTKHEVADQGTMTCPGDVTVNFLTYENVYNRPGRIERCFVTADTPMEADAQALNLAQGAHGCDSDTYTEYVVCTCSPTPTPTKPDPGPGPEPPIPPVPSNSPTPSPTPSATPSQTPPNVPSNSPTPEPPWPTPWPSRMHPCDFRECHYYSAYWSDKLHPNTLSLYNEPQVIELMAELNNLETELAQLIDND